jgi:hypothetical protein
VRKVSDLPGAVEDFMGYAHNWGAAPDNSQAYGGASPTAHQRAKPDETLSLKAKCVKKVNQFVLLVLVLTLCGTVLSAQERPEFKMPCPDVLKMGLDKFVNAYGEKTQDFSTYGQKQAYGYYVDCKRPANDIRARQLPELQRKQVDAVREALNEIGNGSWANAYILAGGGTMYGLASVSAYAVREDVMATLISAMTSHSDGRARRRANAAIGRTRRSLPDASKMPILEYWDEASRPEQITAYRTNVGKIRKAFTELEAIIRILPDRAADLVAHRMEDEMDAGVEE